MSLTSIRQAIKTELAADLAVEFVDGKLEGPVERRGLGCIWTDGVEEDEENVLYEWATVRARVFVPYFRDREPTNPTDPAELEQLAEQIQSSLQDKQATQTGADFIRVTAVEIDMDRLSVTATIRCSMSNPFAGV